MEHRHGQVGLVPFTAAVSPDAAAILTNLSSALGAGNDLSPVIEKLALSILPEWRHLQFERHAYQKQIEDLQGKIAMLEQDLTAATVAALATPTNASRMSDELLTGAPSAAEPDGQLSSLGSYQGKRFLKSIHDLDPSARRKRRAKFVRCLLELCELRLFLWRASDVFFRRAPQRPSAALHRNAAVAATARFRQRLTLPRLPSQRTRMGWICPTCQTS